MNYCSIEEAWGLQSSSSQNKIDNNEKTENKYENLNENSKKERNELITNMNNVERIPIIKNETSSEFEKYRFNPKNNVSENDVSKIYSPFNEVIEKKYLLDKLNFLESQLNKMDVLRNSNIQSNNIENFDNNKSENNYNQNNSSSNYEVSKSNAEYNNNHHKNIYNTDIIDLIFLICIGLIIIFIMNSIFSLGKSIGIRNSSL